MTKLAVVALGGNALLRSGQKGTYAEQLQNVQDTCNSLLQLVSMNYNLVIGHGNGPQVGNVLLQQDAGRKVYELQVMPMDFCVAETQGSIGYMIERTLRNELAVRKLRRNVVTMVTEVVVDRNDERFANPTKPIGPYYTKEQADRMAEADGSIFREDPKGNGWRKVVASPVPLEIINVDIVKRLAAEGNIVITAGGGGIPVYRAEAGKPYDIEIRFQYFSGLVGVEAVIDKDLASALTAVRIGADEFYILTDVPKVYVNFRKPDEKALDTITVAEAERYIEEKQFSEGSMLPKVKAALYFVRNGGKECVITDATQLGVPGGGTRIVP